MSSVKPGDWICRKCGQHNFASRKECKRPNCNEWRPNPKKPGDWDCHNCKKIVFASKTNCFKCQTPKPNSSPSNSSSQRQPGDWDCPDCGDINFGTRPVCRKCGKPRNQPNNSSDTGECVVCLDKTATHAPSGCGHLSMCEDCGKIVDKCPMCRRDFSQFELVKIFTC